MLDSTRRFRGVVFLCALLVTALSTGCSTPSSNVGTSASSGGAEPSATATWGRDALADAQPCVLALNDGPGAALKAVALDGRVAADDLWAPPADASSLLLDADPSGPRVAIGVSSAPTETPADIRDRIVVLRSDGTTAVASEPLNDFPLVSSAVFLDGGDLLWLRRMETASSIDTTIGITDGRTGKRSAVALSGPWPAYRYVAAFVPLRARTAVAVLVKVNGTPAPHDDFAVILADYQHGELVARSTAYRDDMLFTLGPGPVQGTLVYARSQSADSSQADQIIEIMPKGQGWSTKLLLSRADCDPGFDYAHVCSGGPDKSVLYRSGMNPSGTTQPVWLMLLANEAKAAKPTGIDLPKVGNQWIWLDKPLL